MNLERLHPGDVIKYSPPCQYQRVDQVRQVLDYAVTKVQLKDNYYIYIGDLNNVLTTLRGRVDESGSVLGVAFG